MRKTPKVIQLLNLLDNKELKKLKKRLQRDKRHRLIILVENLVKLKNDPFTEILKKELFQKLFEESYSSKKDYLLRNEFRLLSQQVEQLLVDTEIKEERENNVVMSHYYLLQSLQKRKALELFQKEYPDTYEQALEHQDYYAAHNIIGLNFLNITQFQSIKDKDLPYLEKLNELQLTHLSCYYLTAFRQHQIDQSFIHNSLYHFSTEESQLTKQVVVDFDPFETDYSSYLFLKAKSFVVPLANRNAILKQCLEIAKHHFIKNELLFDKEVKFCLSSLANTYRSLTEFKEANAYYKAFFEVCKIHEDPQRLAVMGDYVANLINLHLINEAIQLLEENAAYANEIPRLKPRWQCLQIACYAFVEENAKLSQALPASFSSYNLATKYYFRFYLGISAYLKHRLEDAYREIENFRHLTSGKDENNSIHPVVNFFHRFFYTCFYHSIQEKNYSTNLGKLSFDVQQFTESSPPELRSYLPLLWLKKKLQMIVE